MAASCWISSDIDISAGEVPSNPSELSTSCWEGLSRDGGPRATRADLRADGCGAVALADRIFQHSK